MLPGASTRRGLRGRHQMRPGVGTPLSSASLVQSLGTDTPHRRAPVLGYCGPVRSNSLAAHLVLVLCLRGAGAAEKKSRHCLAVSWLAMALLNGVSPAFITLMFTTQPVPQGIESRADLLRKLEAEEVSLMVISRKSYRRLTAVSKYSPQDVARRSAHPQHFYSTLGCNRLRTRVPDSRQSSARGHRYW